jgi:hypothetical protein
MVDYLEALNTNKFFIGVMMIGWFFVDVFWVG